MKPSARSVDSCSRLNPRQCQPSPLVLLSFPVPCAAREGAARSCFFLPKLQEGASFTFGTQTLPEAAIAFSAVAHGVTCGGGSQATGAGREGSCPLSPVPPGSREGRGRSRVLLLSGTGTAAMQALEPGDGSSVLGEWGARQGRRHELSAELPGTFPTSSLPQHASQDKGWENRRCCRKIHPDQPPEGSKLLQKLGRVFIVSLGYA